MQCTDDPSTNGWKGRRTVVRYPALNERTRGRRTNRRSLRPRYPNFSRVNTARRVVATVSPLARATSDSVIGSAC